MALTAWARTTTLAILLATLAFDCRPSLAQTPATYHARADQALQSFLLKFWNGGQQYLRRDYPDSGALTGYWAYANGWDALLDGVERTGGQQYRGLIESFYAGQEERGWFAGYYDDECWMTLVLTRAYDLTGDAKYLNKAKELYADIMTAWDTTCCGAKPGGLWWDKARTQKATAANAGAALAGARLFLRTGDATYLRFAQQAYDYWYANMVNTSTFQVADHFETNGNKVWWKFTYNEGLMIGASVELYEATGIVSYLNTAHRIAGFMVGNEVTSTAYGRVLHDGSNTGCGGDCSQFKGPAYRYLMRLYSLNTTKSQYYNVLKASADAIWNLARNPTDLIFSTSWAGPTETNVDQGRMNAACAALSRFAEQYGGYPGSGIPFNQFEAEDATARHIALEASYGNFTGWGYLAAWNANNQSVDFAVSFPTAGTRTLAFRYAAGAGNASRLIRINGATAFGNLSFAGTGAWSTYRTNTVSRYFSAGTNTISMVFSSSSGSANWLNLDNLTIPDLPLETVAITKCDLSTPGRARLTWTAVPGNSYRLQARSGLTGGNWTNIGTPTWATGAIAEASVPIGSSAQGYYRIVRP